MADIFLGESAVERLSRDSLDPTEERWPFFYGLGDRYNNFCRKKKKTDHNIKNSARICESGSGRNTFFQFRIPFHHRSIKTQSLCRKIIYVHTHSRTRARRGASRTRSCRSSANVCFSSIHPLPFPPPPSFFSFFKPHTTPIFRRGSGSQEDFSADSRMHAQKQRFHSFLLLQSAPCLV